MPLGVGYPPGQLRALADAARAQQGRIPQPGIPGLDVNAVLLKFRQGKLPTGMLLALLAALTGSSPAIGGGEAGAAAEDTEQPSSPILQAMMGQ